VSGTWEELDEASGVVLALAGEGWVRAGELRRRLGAEAPGRWSAIEFYRLVRRLVGWGLVEVRREATDDDPEQGMSIRAAMVETAGGPVTRLRWEMEKVCREMYEERAALLARAHLRRHVEGAGAES
jgi:hypothetical protein